MSKAFSSDHFIAAEVKRLIDKHNIQTVIETGTYQGNTAVWFVENLENSMQYYIGIENVIEHCVNTEEAIANLPIPIGHARIDFKDSSKHLGLTITKAKGPFLFYLDAHWGNQWPLLDELRQIAEAGIKPVIVIHDFYNPNWKEAGLGEKHYDEYGGQRLDLEYITERLCDIYAPITQFVTEGVLVHPLTTKSNIYHLTESVGSKRGCLFIEPV